MIADTAKTVIDLFCGAGGLSEGFRQAGFHVLAGQDYDDMAGRTFSATHHEARFIGGPIEQVTPQQLLDAAGKKRGEIDVICGGPPCQGYSVYNHQRGANDPRAGLFRQYLRIVEGIMPRWLVMENVTGITSIAGGAIVRQIYEEMNRLGYQVEMRVLRAEDYGVPQERRRGRRPIGRRRGRGLSVAARHHQYRYRRQPHCHQKSRYPVHFGSLL